MVDTSYRHWDKSGKRVTSMKKMKTIDMIRELHKRELMPFVYRFVKAALFHTAFEMFISVYMIELVVCLTRFFLTDPTQISTIMLLIVISLAVTFFMAGIYGGIAVHIYTKYVYECATEYLDHPDVKYEDVVRTHRDKIRLSAFNGVLAYVLSTSSISLIVRYE